MSRQAERMTKKKRTRVGDRFFVERVGTTLADHAASPIRTIDGRLQYKSNDGRRA